MAEIKIISKQPADKAITIFREALKAEESRVGYALKIGKKRLATFEEKYGVSSDTFISQWTAEKLEGRDLEYVEWAGEAKLVSRLKERLSVLKGIEYVTS